MPDQVLKEVTHLGSTLAELATKQLDAVIDELRGTVGDGRKPGGPTEPPRRVNVGTMAFNVLQLASKFGSLLTQLSEYDLVRRNVPALTLKSSNPLTALRLQSGEPYGYELLIENDGDDELKLSVEAELTEADQGPLGNLEIEPSLERLFAMERRRVKVLIPGLAKGEYCLTFTVKTVDKSEPKVIGQKRIALHVLPGPQQHEP
jgi:hypothetical protein